MKKRKKPKSRAHLPKVEKTSLPVVLAPPSLPKRVWTKVVAIVAAVSAFLGFAGWIHEQYVRLTPVVTPMNADISSRSPPAFIVKNDSPYFRMEDIELICGIDSARFLTTDGKPVGFSMPITSGRKNGPLSPNGDSAEFRCDPSAFMKMENGELSLMGMQTKSFNSAGGDLKLAAATVWIGVKRKSLGIKLESTSPMWELKHSGDSYSWEEARPVFK